MALTYRDKSTSRTQTAVYSGELCIGHIGKQVLSAMVGSPISWRWDFSLNAAPVGFERHGHADTYEDAKAAVERNWQLRLKVVGLADCDKAAN